MIDSKYLTPKQIVEELDKYIIGQYDAKRNVAIALRNRWRRMHVQSDIQSEIIPNNILMIGATGVGKTEIARRLAGGSAVINAVPCWVAVPSCRRWISTSGRTGAGLKK